LNFEISATNGGAILCSALSCASDVTTAPILAPVHDK
jgi:predicted outer membrane repeat protein